MSDVATEADLLSDIDPVLLRQGDLNASEATFATRVYLAGPMRGIAEFNFPAFDSAAAQLRGAGYEVWSPAEHDRAHGFDSTEMTGHEDLAEYGFSLRDALTRDMAEVAKSDAICLLDGWERSKGAKAEHALAEALWIQTGTLEEYLPAEPMSEHEYLTGGAFLSAVEVDMAKAVVDQIGERLGIAPALNDLVPQVWADAYIQAEKDRDARLDRLDHFLASDEALGELRVRYPTATLATPARSAWLDTDVLPIVVTGFEPDETRVTSSTGGQKGKKLAQYDLIPTRPLRAVAELYGYGASKYKKVRNWEKGYDWSLSYAALQRHANLFWSRENDDAETGLPHLAAVVFHALALMEYRTTHPEFDDRPEVCRAPAPTPRLIDGEC